MREVADGVKAGHFDFEGGVEVLATLRADLEDVPFAQREVARV